jgi:hypothetical protein
MLIIDSIGTRTISERPWNCAVAAARSGYNAVRAGRDKYINNRAHLIGERPLAVGGRRWAAEKKSGPRQSSRWREALRGPLREPVDGEELSQRSRL